MANAFDEIPKRLLIEKIPPEPSEVDIGFETSERGWAISVSKPMVNLYPYDMWEDHEPHSSEWTMERDDNKRRVR